MSTPEGKVKKLVKEILEAYSIYPASKAGDFPNDAEGWYYMPGQSGYGVSGIPDFLGHYRGQFWAIETKAPKKKPTGFQLLQLNAIHKSRGARFVVDGLESVKTFEEWLMGVV